MKRPAAVLTALALCLLLASCRGPGDADTQPEATAAASHTHSAVSTPAPTPTPEAAASPTPTAVPLPSVTPEPTPDWSMTEGDTELEVRLDGEVVHIMATEREYLLREDPMVSFRMVVPDSLIRSRYTNNAWYFPFSGGETDRSWLELSLIGGADAAEILPDFMNAYLQFTEIEFSGESEVGSLYAAETITASGEDKLVKAWLINVPGGVFSVVLCCSFDHLSLDVSCLEAMLQTLTLSMEN